MALPLWAAIFGSMYQLSLLIWGIVKFQSFISFCRGANYSGQYEYVKNALLLCIFSYAPLVAISVTFMWVSYDKAWDAGIVFVMLPSLSVLFFFLFLLATVNDITNQIDINRKGRKRLPIQPPPQLIVAPANLNDTSLVVNTPTAQRAATAAAGGGSTGPKIMAAPGSPRSGGSEGAPPALPIQSPYRG